VAAVAERTATGRNCAAGVGADSSRLRHLLKLLRGIPRAAQNASTVSPEARCCKINVRQPSIPRRTRLRGVALPESPSFAFIVCLLKLADDLRLNTAQLQGWFPDGYDSIAFARNEVKISTAS
jgi:hypothetical protein